MTRFLVAAFLLTSVAVSAQTPEEKRATIKWLRDLQTPDGGFLPAPLDARLDLAPKGGLRATSSAIRALKYFGGTPNSAEAAGKFATVCYDAEAGGFAEQPGGKADLFTTAVGLMAAAELKLPLETFAKGADLLATAREFEDVRIAAAGFETLGRLPPTAADWIASVSKGANADGTFGTGTARPRATGSAVVTLLRLGHRIPQDRRDAVLAVLNMGQQADGGYGRDETAGSDLETSYRVMRCYKMLGAKPAGADALRGYIARCRNADGGYGVSPGKPSTVGGTYFAGVVLHWLSEP